MSYEKELFDEVIYDAAEKLSPSDATDLREWVESLEFAKRKADEYEAKAKVFDESLEAIRVNLKSVRSDYGGFTLNALKKQRVATTENVLEAMEILMVGLLEYHESGGPYAEK